MSASAPADHAVGRIAGSIIFPAALSMVAGVIHAAVVPEHLEEWWFFGAFFIITAVFQLAWAAVVVLRPSAIVYTTGALVNGAIIAVWALSRAVGLPIGPEAWMPEPASTLDVAATLTELLLVVSVVLTGLVLTASSAFARVRERRGHEVVPVSRSSVPRGGTTSASGSARTGG